MAHRHIVGQIKREVDDAFERNYTRSNQKKQLKYYSLYLPSIVRIQRAFRGYLVKKTHHLEKQISKKLTERKKNSQIRQKMQKSITQAKEKRIALREVNFQEAVKFQKENIDKNIEKMIKNVVEAADKYSENVAMSKVELAQFKRLTTEEEELECEIKELTLEKQCYDQRMNNWKQKLTELRERIIEETTKKRLLEEELSKLQ